MSPQSFEVLLVEDNPGDVHLALEAFKSSPTPANVHVAGDGEAALRFLEERLEVQAEGLDLVVLDLNLPRMNGHEVLARMREEKRSEGIPVVVLTSSDRESDIQESYGLRANCVVTKPVDGQDYMKLVRAIHRHFALLR